MLISDYFYCVIPAEAGIQDSKIIIILIISFFWQEKENI